METTFSIFETVAEVKFSFVLNFRLFRDGGNEIFSGIFFFSKLTLVSIEQIAVLVVFGEKKCNFKSMLRFAVVEFEEIDATFS